MKLRFRKNSLRFRVNQEEVASLRSGQSLAERMTFTGGATLDYILSPTNDATTAVAFDGKAIRVNAPLHAWAQSDEIGFYFEAEPGLKVAIEKDLECVDGPPEEQDPHAYPRSVKSC